MSWTVPLADLHIEEEDVEAVMDVLRSGWLTMGPRIQDFEGALGDWLGSPNVVTTSSGTAALHLAYLAAGIGPGDEVIVPAFTFVASASAVRLCGGVPVLCDVISPECPLISPEDVERRITPRTKAVTAVHFAGYAAEMAPLRALCDAHGLVLIEDCAQAIGASDSSGARTGAIGDLGCYSFFSKKQLSIGEGGAVATEDPELADRVRSLRSHAMTSGTWDRHRGHESSYDVVDIGFNYRMDESRAALGLSRLSRLDAELEARRAIARSYRERLAGVPGVEPVWRDEDVGRATHFAFLVLLADRDERDRFRGALSELGVQTTWYPALHGFTEYAGSPAWGELPQVEAVAERHCALPMSPSMGDREVDLVADAIRATLG